MADTALGLSPAQWSSIGAFIAIISLLYVIWWNHRKEQNAKKARSSTKMDKDEKTKSKLARQKLKLEKEKMKALKKEVKLIKKNRLEIIEAECKITKKKPHLQLIGELTEGFKIEGTCRGTLGGKFSYYILDEVNKDLYKKDGDLKSPIRSGIDKNKFTFKITVPRDNRYYILFTTRATKNPRNVHYKIRISVD